MARKYIVRKLEVLRRRASNWELHYQRRACVSRMTSYEVERVLNGITRYVPTPEMDGDGALVRDLKVIRGQAEAIEALRLDPAQRELMCVWYWWDEAWKEFERLFNALPDVTEDYYLFYDAARDVGLLVPLSYNCGTTEVQVAELYPKPRRKRVSAGVAREVP